MDKKLRLVVEFSTNTLPIPFDYVHKQCVYFYGLLGETPHHDSRISLYSYSMLRGQSFVHKDALYIPEPYMFISSYDEDVLARVKQSLERKRQANFGMMVERVSYVDTPNFQTRQFFPVTSGILLRSDRVEGSNYKQYYLPSDEPQITSELLTRSLKGKMNAAGLDGDVRVSFAPNVFNGRQKSYNINGIHNKVSHHPIIVEGSREIVGLAWAAGVGQSTGCGFGSLQ